MKKFFPVFVLVSVITIVSLFLFPSCAAAPAQGGAFRLIRYVSPGTPIGWPAELGATDKAVSICSLESFLRVKVDMSLEPALATEWKIADDKSSITFSLRKGVKFHDGTDWNAEAAKFNLDAIKTAKRPESRQWKSIDVIDDYTIRISLTGWQNIIVEDIGSILMVSPTAYKTMGLEKIRWNPVGTGAFKFVSHERDVATKFVKFEEYWQKGKPKVDELQLIVITDPVTQLASMEAGEGDALWTPNLKTSADLKAMKYESIYRHDGTFSLTGDSANPNSPFANAKVRQAVEYAIDRAAIAKALGYGFWEPAYQIACPFNIGYIKNMKGRQYDPEKAKALLKEAGYSSGFKTKIAAFPGTAKEIMAAIQSNLAAVGITAELEFPDMAKLTEYRRKGWTNMMIGAPWVIHTNLGRTFLSYAISNSGDYVNMYRPPSMDGLINTALNTTQIEQQKLEAIVKLWSDESVTVPLYYIGAPRTMRQGKVHDTGFFAYSTKDDWSPESVWLSK